MKGFYNITNAQFAMMWMFGIIGTFAFLGRAFEGGNTFDALLAVVIPFFLLFYTLGRVNR